MKKKTYTQEDLVKYLDTYILCLEADITLGSAFLDQATPVFSTSQKLIREGIESAKQEIEAMKLIKETLLGN